MNEVDAQHPPPLFPDRRDLRLARQSRAGSRTPGGRDDAAAERLMGKTVGGLPEAAPLALEADAEEAFALGSWLTRQRELRGISREELAALTRLPMRSLERLETGAFDGQQDGFVRGFVRTVAVAIGLDPDDAVARLLAEPAAHPLRRGPDPRRVAVAAVGVAGLIALGAALLEWAQTPSDVPTDAERRPSCARIRCARSRSSTACSPQTSPQPRSSSSRRRRRPTQALTLRSAQPRRRPSVARRSAWPRSTPRPWCCGRSISASRIASCICSRRQRAACPPSRRARAAAAAASPARST